VKPALPIVCALALAVATALAPRAAQSQDGESPPGAAVQHSSSCARCHSNADGAEALRDAAGRGIAPHDLWSGTMMANASLDPLWRAAVSIEVAATPAAREAIETKCVSCHAPMGHLAAFDGERYGEFATPMDVLHDDGPVGELARDGVSCSVCHGIAPDGLGTAASFSGGFELDPWNRLFGPHTDPRPQPMTRATGFTPTHGEHVIESALCATCHTLETHTLDEQGAPTGHVLLEQGAYLEWRTSIFDTESPRDGHRGRACQECHVPRYDEDGREIETGIARRPDGKDFPFVEPRRPFGRHAFVGGNTLVLGMLADHAEELGVTASPEALARTRAATLEQLRTRTASVGVDGVELDGDRLRFEVTVVNRTGHKLPTGHPTRRVFLRATVRDADGAVLFSSGATDGTGRVVDTAGRPLASESAGGPVQPHRDTVTASDQLVEYRSVMADAEGAPTHVLMRGARYLVDTRLLPRGFDPEHPDAPRVAPVGTEGDDDFTGGRDRVRFEITVPSGARPANVEVEVCYQTLSARWADEMAQYDTEEVRRFLAMYATADREPVVLASARAEL